MPSSIRHSFRRLPTPRVSFWRRRGGAPGDRLAVHAPPSKGRQARDILINGRTISKSPEFEQQTPETLKLSYWDKLRKREIPYALSVNNDNSHTVAWRMFMGTYKGATDFVTKHVWPYPAFLITRAIAPWKVTPNMVTTLSALFVIAAYLLFERGMYGTGLLAAWIMALLDTVDGKLARVTLTSSKWGDIFDHGIDLIHPPFWYAAWGFGLAAAGHSVSSSLLWWTLGVLFCRLYPAAGHGGRGNQVLPP